MTNPEFVPLTLNDIKVFIEAYPDGHWLTGDGCNCPVAMAYESRGIHVNVEMTHVISEDNNRILATHTADIKRFIEITDTYSGSINAQECLSIIREIQEEDGYDKAQ